MLIALVNRWETDGNLLIKVGNRAQGIRDRPFCRSKHFECFMYAFIEDFFTWWIEDIMSGEIRDEVFFEWAIRCHFKVIENWNKMINSWWTKWFWYSGCHFASFSGFIKYLKIFTCSLSVSSKWTKCIRAKSFVPES